MMTSKRASSRAGSKSSTISDPLATEAARLREEAAAAKARERRQRAPRPSPPPRKPKQQRGRDSFATWLNVTWWWLANAFGVFLGCVYVTVLVMTAEAAFGDEGSALGRQAFTAAVCLLPMWWIASVIQRGWRGRLSFAVDGWDFLFAPNADGKVALHDSDYWVSLKIDVQAENTEAIEPLLTLFCVAANDAFYRADDPNDDSRMRWTSTQVRAEGAANARVLARVRKLCFELQRLHAMGAGVTKVELRSATPFYVSRWSSDA